MALVFQMVTRDNSCNHNYNYNHNYDHNTAFKELSVVKWLYDFSVKLYDIYYHAEWLDWQLWLVMICIAASFTI